MHLAGRSSFNIDGHDQECIYVLSMADLDGEGLWPPEAYILSWLWFYL